MKTWVIIVIIVSAVLVLSLGYGGFRSFNGASGIQKGGSGKVMCGELVCLDNHFSSCTPAETSMSSGGQSVTITIHGLENGKCHFTMAFGNVTAANCYFKQEDLTDKVFNQMFGNKEGQDAIIAEACGAQ